MTIPINTVDFLIEDKKAIHGKNLHELYQARIHRGMARELLNDAAALACFSTPFDETSVDFLESLNVPMYKIASFEQSFAVNKKVAQTGKPMIISTGMATLSDLEDMKAAKDNGCRI